MVSKSISTSAALEFIGPGNRVWATTTVAVGAPSSCPLVVPSLPSSRSARGCCILLSLSSPHHLESAGGKGGATSLVAITSILQSYCIGMAQKWIFPAIVTKHHHLLHRWADLSISWWLLDHGADANRQRFGNQSPILIAAANGYLELVRM